MSATLPATQLSDELGVANPNHVIGPTLYLKFQAPWEFARGYRTCYILLPNLTHHDAWLPSQTVDISGKPISLPLPVYDVPLVPTGERGLDFVSQQPRSGPLGPVVGSNTVLVTDGVLRLDESTPPPSEVGLPATTWACSRESQPANPVPPGSFPECSAVLVVDGSNRDGASSNCDFCSAGTFISGGLIGTAAGLRRFVFDVG